MDNGLTLEEAQAIGAKNYSPIAESLYQISQAGIRFNSEELSCYRADFKGWVNSDSATESEAAKVRLEQMLRDKGCKSYDFDRLMGMPITTIEWNESKKF